MIQKKPPVCQEKLRHPYTEPHRPALAPWKSTHLLHIWSVATSALPRRIVIFNWALCISRKNLYPVNEEVESSSWCSSHFSAEKCFALKVPGKESCQVKKIYWMHFQKGIWHFCFSDLRKVTFLSSYIKYKGTQRQKYPLCVRMHGCNFFLFNHVFIANYFIHFPVFRCLPASHLQMLNLLVFPLFLRLFLPRNHIIIGPCDSSVWSNLAFTS